jgi:hypothetical protein
MDLKNLGIVFGPTLLRPVKETLETMMSDTNIVNSFTATLIEKHSDLFEADPVDFSSLSSSSSSNTAAAAATAAAPAAAEPETPSEERKKRKKKDKSADAN